MKTFQHIYKNIYSCCSLIDFIILRYSCDPDVNTTDADILFNILSDVLYLHILH